MNEKKSLLHYRVSEPKVKSGEKSPLLLLLHGYGANEDDLFSLVPYLDARFRVISVRAPVTLFTNAYAWFNINFTPEGILVDNAQVENSLKLLRSLIDEILDKYKSEISGLYLMGFSQGSMMCLTTALSNPGLTKGIVIMSGRLIPSASALNEDSLRGLPVFVAHGTHDPLLPIAEGRRIRDFLAKLPVDMTYREYDMYHEVSPDSLRDISTWLSNSLNK